MEAPQEVKEGLVCTDPWVLCWKLRIVLWHIYWAKFSAARKIFKMCFQVVREGPTRGWVTWERALWGWPWTALLNNSWVLRWVVTKHFTTLFCYLSFRISWSWSNSCRDVMLTISSSLSRMIMLDRLDVMYVTELLTAWGGLSLTAVLDLCD